MDKEARKKTTDVLNRLSCEIGSGVSNLCFEIQLKDHDITLTAEDFDLTARENSAETVFSGRWRDIKISWFFRKANGGYLIGLTAESGYSLNISAMKSLILEYKPKSQLMDWRALQYSADYVNNPIGFPKVSEALKKKNPCKAISGVFPDNKNTGLFFGTSIPQSSIHKYEMEKLEDEALRFTCTTTFISTLAASPRLCSETTWVCANQSVRHAFGSYSAFIPNMPASSKPAVGWNSWDYYYFTISLDGMLENMDEIIKDPVLSAKIKYVVVDEGWEHMNGEWQANYKFPGGLERLVKEITDRGFVPGIWTAPILIDPMSYPAWRMPKILVKNEFGDPFSYSGFYMVDPTAPAGKEFLRELFTRLYKIGFRFFKADFVSNLLHADRFYDVTKGPYDAIKELFAIIRDCVTEESHILGCSLPAECGQGLADSGRTGIDIHNQWNHLEWATECFTFKYWMNRRIWINDPDFLTVRGKDTSFETETTVLNPNANNPNPPRWRRGDVFTKEEARTWTNIVLLAGGNVFLSDRLSILNEEGRKLIHKGLETTGIPAQPLDFCCDYHASLWLQELELEYRLTQINWSDEEKLVGCNFKEFGLSIPTEVTDWWTEEKLPLTDGTFFKELKAHESVVISWPKQSCEV